MKSLLDLGGESIRPLAQAELDLLARCWFADMYAYQPFSDAEAEEAGLRCLTLLQKLAWASVEVSLPTALFAAYLFAAYMSRGQYESLLMWAYTLTQLTRKLDRPIRVPDLVVAFPKGFPTEVGERKVWASQKDGESNRLDARQIWVTSAKSGR
jgi:hypothetical protein